MISSSESSGGGNATLQPIESKSIGGFAPDRQKQNESRIKQWINFVVSLGIPQSAWQEIEHCTIGIFQMFSTYLKDEAKTMNGY